MLLLITSTVLHILLIHGNITLSHMSQIYFSPAHIWVTTLTENKLQIMKYFCCLMFSILFMNLPIVVEIFSYIIIYIRLIIKYKHFN